MGRRELVRTVAAAMLATACGAPPSPRSSTTPPAGASRHESLRALPRSRSSGAFAGPVEVHAWFDLPDDPRSRELSGIAWDESTRTLWAVQDETANIVPIIAGPDLKSWRFGEVVALETTFPLDLEGIAVVRGGFLVASEIGPRILEVDRRGKLRRELPLPEHFSNARDNKSIESLASSPDGSRLFTTTEGALRCDGDVATARDGTLVRLLRMTRDGSDADEHAYRTDPLPHDRGGDHGVADLAAVSDDEVLVLERGWSRGAGNDARVYEVSLGDATTSCLGAEALTAEAPVLTKRLVVDLAKAVAIGLPRSKQIQPSPLMDNYEGMAIGPLLPDGRRTLILVSDDNGRNDQFARIVVLAVG